MGACQSTKKPQKPVVVMKKQRFAPELKDLRRNRLYSRRMTEPIRRYHSSHTTNITANGFGNLTANSLNTLNSLNGGQVNLPSNSQKEQFNVGYEQDIHNIPTRNNIRSRSSTAFTTATTNTTATTITNLDQNSQVNSNVTSSMTGGISRSNPGVGSKLDHYRSVTTGKSTNLGSPTSKSQQELA